jgi:hypothetical protein
MSEKWVEAWSTVARTLADGMIVGRWHDFLMDSCGNLILNGLKRVKMNDHKIKAQQPRQGNKQDKEMNQNGQTQPGHKSNTNEDQDRQRMKSDIENPDQPDTRKNEIDDNPDETKKKIPNMHGKH